MSTESNLVEIQKLVKLFKPLIDAEGALIAAASAEGKERSAKKAAADAQTAAAAAMAAETKDRADAAKIRADMAALVAETKDKAAAMILKAEADAKSLIDFAKKSELDAAERAKAMVAAATSQVTAAQAQANTVGEQIAEAEKKLAAIRAAINAVVGK